MPAFAAQIAPEAHADRQMAQIGSVSPDSDSAAVAGLASRGMKPIEIARELELPVGEVEVLLALALC
jgi:hypothetical protein